ncbi:hypothetical protein SAMN05192588_2271 [Nonlabens sp. Hel1_33_55]|uniref:DUF5694 domain-containing protein n=1 Tax=Nonlabens sp. Hel1_33_55 TaxID=1336802 RepID=UPI000875DD89|nr:DUF5694 domain-containing protein [Nonlabens sp. Hel1_33_55]SCY32606.1 hypothetical protein SAMN05192588_2271 [Nonlabens sp. Hel1_33_55]
MRTFILSIALIAIATFTTYAQDFNEEQFLQQSKKAFQFDGADVLLLGTWHMGYTSDANKSSYDASLPERRIEISELAVQLATEFKPTKILVEVTPEEQQTMDSLYAAYVKNPKEISTYHGEVGLLAFQIARASDATLHAIDHKMGYDYNSIAQLAAATGNTIMQDYYGQLMPVLGQAQQLEKTASTKQLYRFSNTPEYLSFLKNVNADLMTYVNTDDNFEGADTAADFYKRNLRIFANINRLEITPEDRVLVLNGGAHVAFFHEFMKNSPRYNVVDAQEFLRG